jgi:threonine dehydratase
MDKTDLTAGPERAEVDRADVLAATRRIAADVRHTPLWRLPGRALGLDVAEVWLKLEHLQAGGSFKARGMFNRLRSAQVPEAGVVIASGGNAGIAAAHAARALGVRCEVFLPEVATPAKRARLAGLGAQVTVEGAVYPEALAACLRRQAQTGALLMHAYDQPEVVAGAGTLGVEIDADAGPPDRVLVSVGGGGLVAGLAAWYARRCRIDALEPSRAPTLHAARAAGAPVDVEVGGVAADSLGARRIGAIAWALQTHVQGAHLLDDEAITRAQRRMWAELRLAVEPAAALPLAALWEGVLRPAPQERVAVIVCGANTDPATLEA